MKIRRSNFLFFYHSDQKLADMRFKALGILLKDGEIFAFPLVLGSFVVLPLEEVRLLLEVPSDRWIFSSQVDIPSARLTFFIQNGLLLSDEKNEPQALTFAWREEVLEKQEWNLFSALQFFMGRWKGVDSRMPLSLMMHDEGMKKAPLPPPPLSPIKETLPAPFPLGKESDEEMALPSFEPREGLEKLFSQRRTCRNFDSETPMRGEDFSALLHYVFKAQGQYDIPKKYRVLKKNNPSGGALHPLNLYLLVMRVEGVQPGLYEYRMDKHLLKLRKSYALSEAVEKARLFACNQAYAGEASALFVLSSRFFRSFWKYRRHSKMLSYHYQEAGHVSQNFYLVAGSLGLGAFTTSMNDWDVDLEIGLDSFQEGSLMLLGCGIPQKNEEAIRYEEMKFEDLAD